jgi:general secretion pathway protein H
MTARSSSQSGFTLLELMVVLVLVGIIFSFAILSIGGDDLAEAMERETRRLETLIAMASEEAVLRSEEVAIHFREDGYTFLLLQADGWQEPENDALLRSRTLPAGITLRLEVEGDPPRLGMGEKNKNKDKAKEKEDAEEHPVPQVFILSSGEMTPFAVTLEADQSPLRYHLSASLMGELEWEQEEAF